MCYKQPIYYIVYDWMVQELRLKGGAERDIYALLYSLADSTGTAKVSLRYLQERTGYSDKSIRMAIKSLYDGGWVMKSRGQHYGLNEYVVVEPASIIGRFDRGQITAVKTTGDLAITAVKTTAEQRQNLPVILEKTTADTPYYIFDNNIYNNFFITDEPSEKKEKDILLKEFFSAYGLYQPMDEVVRFWAYHEQTGWRNAKGQRIVSKKSAARFWTIRDDARRQSEFARKLTSRMMRIIPDEAQICFIAELSNVYQGDKVLTLVLESDKVAHIIEDSTERVKAMGTIIGSLMGVGTRVEYRILK